MAYETLSDKEKRATYDRVSVHGGCFVLGVGVCLSPHARGGWVGGAHGEMERRTHSRMETHMLTSSHILIPSLSLARKP